MCILARFAFDLSNIIEDPGSFIMRGGLSETTIWCHRSVRDDDLIIVHLSAAESGKEKDM